MKVMYKSQVGEYNIVRFVIDAAFDPEASKKEKKRVCCKVGPEAEMISDEQAGQIQHKLDAMGEHQLLLVNGKYIPNYHGVEYLIKESGKWLEKKIEEIGLDLPASAVLRENLTKEQQKEISAQREAERIAGLAPEEKEKEKKAKLHALAREALNKAEEADLLGEEFDKAAWLQPKKAELEAVYAA